MRLPPLVVACVLGATALLGGCVSVKTAPIKIEPVHITVDVNLRVARELDSYFAELDERENRLIQQALAEQAAAAPPAAPSAGPASTPPSPTP